MTLYPCVPGPQESILARGKFLNLSGPQSFYLQHGGDEYLTCVVVMMILGGNLGEVLCEQ